MLVDRPAHLHIVCSSRVSPFRFPSELLTAASLAIFNTHPTSVFTCRDILLPTSRPGKNDRLLETLHVLRFHPAYRLDEHLSLVSPTNSLHPATSFGIAHQSPRCHLNKVQISISSLEIWSLQQSVFLGTRTPPNWRLNSILCLTNEWRLMYYLEKCVPIIRV